MPKNHILPPQPPLFALSTPLFGTDYTEKHGLSIINYQLRRNPRNPGAKIHDKGDHPITPVEKHGIFVVMVTKTGRGAYQPVCASTIKLKFFRVFRVIRAKKGQSATRKGMG